MPVDSNHHKQVDNNFTDHLSDSAIAANDLYTALLCHSDQAVLNNLQKSNTKVVRWIIGEQDLQQSARIVEQLTELNSADTFIIVECIAATAVLTRHAQIRQDLLQVILLSDLFICTQPSLQLITQTPEQSPATQKSLSASLVTHSDLLIIDDVQNTWRYRPSSPATVSQGELSFAASSSIKARCTGEMSAAIASFMRCGKRCCDAIVLGLSYLEQISQHYLQAHPLQPANFSPLYYSESWQKETPNAFSWPVTLAYFPNLKTVLNTQALASFNKTDTLALGLYPVIDSLAWLEKLLVLGIKTIQLRIKEVPAPELDSIVAKAAALGKHYNARLFINDHWQLAIKHQCYGVHLGQEDIAESNLEAIQQAGLRLGVSTHGEYEWLRAISIKPSYIAMGTVYPTNTKPAILIGLSNLQNWCQTLAEHYPVVAIGGIKLENIDIVLNTGVRSIALVTAITEAAEYKTATRLLVAKLESDPA